MKSKSLFISMLLMVVTSLMFVSCEKAEDEPEIEKNPLEGTLWSLDGTFSLTGEKYTRYIEFVDNRNVKVWTTNTIWDDPYTGTYEVDGEKVKFFNLYDGYWKWGYIEATFSSKSIIVKYYSNNNKSKTYTKTFVKE